MLKNSEESRVSDLPHTQHEGSFSRKEFLVAEPVEEFVSQSLDNEKEFSKTDLQQSCSQELAKELDLINGGFYDFQEKAIRVIGAHLLNIVCDTTTSEDEKYTKIKELYEHSELYRILGQYGLKHVSLIKLIEKLKHHSYGLKREQIKLLETYGVPSHVRNIQLFIESQFRAMPATTLQEKQDLLYKVIEIASVFNIGVEEEYQLSQYEVELLVDSMSQLLYNVATVESDWKQMLSSTDFGDNRERAVKHFGSNYVREMIHNERVMTYSAKLDHFLQMMTILNQEIGSPFKMELSGLTVVRTPKVSPNIRAFGEFYGMTRLGLLAPDFDLIVSASTNMFARNIKAKQRKLPEYASSLEDTFLDYRLARCADRTLRITPRASRNVYLQDLQSELPERTAELIEQTALLVGVDEETAQWCKTLSRQNTKSFSNFITSKNSLTKLLDFFQCYKINPELLKEKFLLGIEMLRPKKPTAETVEYRGNMRVNRVMSDKTPKKVEYLKQYVDRMGEEFFFSEIETKQGKKMEIINFYIDDKLFSFANSQTLFGGLDRGCFRKVTTPRLQNRKVKMNMLGERSVVVLQDGLPSSLRPHEASEIELSALKNYGPWDRDVVEVLEQLPNEIEYDKDGIFFGILAKLNKKRKGMGAEAFMRLAGPNRYGRFTAGNASNVLFDSYLSRQVQNLLFNDRSSKQVTSKAAYDTFVSLVFRVQPFSLPTAVPQKVKAFEEEWKKKIKEFKVSMLVGSTDKPVDSEPQYMNIDALIESIDKWKKRYVSYRPLPSGEVVTYINHPKLQKKNYYSPSEEDFLKSVSPVSCEVQLGGSINFEYHVKDTLQVRAQSLLGNHHDTIQTDSLYDIISEEYSVTPEDLAPGRKNYTKLFFQSLEMKGIPTSLIMLEDERELTAIICQDLDIPEQDKELKKRIGMQLVLYVLNQKSYFWCGDFEIDGVSQDGKAKQFLFCSPRGGGYFGSMGKHMLKSGKIACYQSSNFSLDKLSNNLRAPILFYF